MADNEGGWNAPRYAEIRSGSSNRLPGVFSLVPRGIPLILGHIHKASIPVKDWQVGYMGPLPDSQGQK